MPLRSIALSCCALLAACRPPPPSPPWEPERPLPDLTFHEVFPTTGSEVPRNLRIWYRESGKVVGPFSDFLHAHLALPGGEVIAHDERGHFIELNSFGLWEPVVEMAPMPEDSLRGSGPLRALYAAGTNVEVRVAHRWLAEYTISDTIDHVPPSPPRVQLAERSVVGGQPAARFILGHDPLTLVVAIRHPHVEPEHSSPFGVTASNELLLVNHEDWVGTAVFDFYSVDVAGNWSTATRVEVPNFGEPSRPEWPVPLQLGVWGPLRAERSEGAILVVEGIRKRTYTVRHEALSAVSASSSAPCLVGTIELPDGWFALQITSPVAARCTLSIHGEANGEAADQTAEIELVSAERLVQRERRSPCLDGSPRGHWHLPNGTDVCLPADSRVATWQLPDGTLRTVEGIALTLLDPTHVLVCTEARCAAVDALGEETSSVPRPRGFMRSGPTWDTAFHGPIHLDNLGLTPADTLPRALTGTVALEGRPIDLLRWDGTRLTADTQPNQFVKPIDGPVCGWGTDWAVGFDVLVVPNGGLVATFATASGERLWEARPSKPYDDWGWSTAPEVQIAEPWMRFEDRLYSAPGVALPDRLPAGLRIRSVFGCFVGADTYPDRDWSRWTSNPYRGLWWFDFCSTPIRQAMTNTSELYVDLKAESDGLWGQTLSGRWDFFSLAP